MDTNVVSELRKRTRRNPGVAAWFAATAGEDLFLSVLVIGELQKGIAALRRVDARAAASIEAWASALEVDYGDRVLPVTVEISRMWGRLSAPDPLPIIDGLLATTAIVHGLTLVTRNVRDVARTGVALLNPFDISVPEQG
ncbi:type II toxin-antitoxin system VapC family toxin [Sorangium sp. So ce1389]|uniref:type II toxin-antitoxin system VapC family toxin n=1 Tax=Sorangium sp. So ce1389 TaxID=3133336 RepID=UPI003F60ADA8